VTVLKKLALIGTTTRKINTLTEDSRKKNSNAKTRLSGSDTVNFGLRAVN